MNQKKVALRALQLGEVVEEHLPTYLQVDFLILILQLHNFNLIGSILQLLDYLEVVIIINEEHVSNLEIV